jgi:hypothetical protein
MKDYISIIISVLSLIISAIVSYRALWKDKAKIKLTSETGVLICKYPSDEKPRNHFVAFSEIYNSGHVSISLTQMGLFALQKRRFRKDKIVDYTVIPCLYKKEGGFFVSKTLFPGELYNVWIHPKRVEGYGLVVQSKYPEMKFELGIYAISADGSKFLSLFSEENLSACRIIILPDEHETQPNHHMSKYPPTSYELKPPSSDQLETLKAIANRSDNIKKTAKKKKGKK